MSLANSGGKRDKIWPVMPKICDVPESKKLTWATHTLAGSIDYVLREICGFHPHGIATVRQVILTN